MQDEESRVEPRPAAVAPEARRAIGKLEPEESVSIAAPSPVQKGRKQKPRAAVGLRAAVPARDASPKSMETRNVTRQRVREDRDKHRQQVWDKLDEARRRADEKRPRVDRFRPTRLDDEPGES